MVAFENPFRPGAGESKPFGASHVNQMLAAMSARGLVFKNRHGRYSFALPLLGRFVRRQAAHWPAQAPAGASF